MQTKNIVAFLLTVIIVMMLPLTTYAEVKKIPLPEKVERYRGDMKKHLKEANLSEFEDIMMGIMMVESGGNSEKTPDVMQSSESAGLPMNSLKSVDASIKQAVKHLGNIVGILRKYDKGYEKNHKLIAQAYNYGSYFATYVAEKGGKFDIEVARIYSKDVVAPSLGNKNGTTYKYVNALSTALGYEYLYLNGGNYLYAEMVAQYVSGVESSSSSSSSDSSSTKGSESSREDFDPFDNTVKKVTQTGVSTRFEIFPDSMQYFLVKMINSLGKFLQVLSFIFGAIMLVFFSLQVSVLAYRIRFGGSNSYHVQRFIDFLTGKISSENLMKRLYINIGIIIFIFTFVYGRFYIHIFKLVYLLLNDLFNMF